MKINTVSCGTATIRKINDQYQVLLVQPNRNREYWGFPKGHVEVNELHEDAAIRETYEETGIKVIISPVVVGSNIVKLKNEIKNVIIYLATCVDENNCEPNPLDKENFAVAWWPISQLPEVHIYQKPIFENLITYIKNSDKNNAA